MPQFSPSLSLALALAPYPLLLPEKEHVQSLLRQQQNWKEFPFLVKRHGIAGTVLANISDLGEEKFPQAVLQNLKHFQYQSSLRNMQLLGTLGQLQKLFSAHQIEFLALKGPLLSHFLYSTFNLRTSVDLDLLVAPAEFPRADALLRENGYLRYEPSVELSPRQARIHAQYRHHYAYRTSPPGISVELHWNLAEPYYLNATLSQNWAQRGVMLQIPGLQCKTLSGEDLLVYSLLHGAKHRWSSAKLLLDVLALLRRSDDLNWEQVRASIHQARMERIAAQALALIKTIWGQETPPALQFLARVERNVEFLMRFSLEALTWRATENRRDPRWFIYGFLIKPGLAYQVHYLSKLLVAPLVSPQKIRPLQP